MALLYLCVCVNSAYAELTWRGERWATEVDGFGTLGLTTSNSDALGFRRDISQRDAVYKGDVSWATDSIFGLQMTGTYRDALKTVLQAKMKSGHRGFEQYINLAFLEYPLFRDASIRAGRLPQDVYLFSESRDVGFSYLWVRPSVEFYGPLLLENFDGVEFGYRVPFSNGSLRWRIAGGEFSTRSHYAGPLVFFTDYDDMISTSISYEGTRFKWRVGVLDANVSHFAIEGVGDVLRSLLPVIEKIPSDLLQAAVNSDLSNAGLLQLSASLGYQRGPWVVQSELGALNFDRYFYAANLGVGYRMGSVTPFVQIGGLRSEERDVPESANHMTPEVQKAFGYIVNVMRNAASQTVVSVGGRWDITPNVALKTQFDRRWLNVGDTYLWLEDPGERARSTINTLSVTLDFMF